MLESRRLRISQDLWSADRIRKAVSNCLALLEEHGLRHELAMGDDLTLAVLANVEDVESGATTRCGNCAGSGGIPIDGCSEARRVCELCNGEGVTS